MSSLALALGIAVLVALAARSAWARLGRATTRPRGDVLVTAYPVSAHHLHDLDAHLLRVTDSLLDRAA